ncbi:peptidase inhibitor family I36 protein [Actinomadura sp. ATCC 31491]|uniref:Peptidase inhibitor family I36 protein n=1 Tax=Actinomadura luzonensis TaxID=2805427 RepID=A0ABT0FLN9_9ACTN|nr:peptidase inhibitor family I36 protein [Actinomadura luzonensis]MCK2213093.1 peptidase inhibitor family I36 protein [Actinomadura luzonensis]
MNNRHLTRALRTAAVAAGAAVVIGGAPPAQAETSGSAAVDAYMAAFPGGTKVSDNEIVWNGGEVRVVLAATAASCKAGYYCVWEHQYWRGRMGAWRASKANCKKFEFTSFWRDRVSSYWARGGCPVDNYFLKDKKKFQPDPFEPFVGKKAYVRFNDRYDYAARGYTD